MSVFAAVPDAPGTVRPPADRLAVCAEVLHHRGTATEALRELAQCRTNVELLDAVHLMWCGPGCGEGASCTFLHHPRTAPRPAAAPRAPRSRYNRDTAELYSLMGGAGYTAHTPQAHEANLWPLLRAVLTGADDGAGARVDWTDWARKGDPTAAEVVAFACRDSLQWTASWCGERYAEQPGFLHYVALSTICDDLCIPPSALVRGEFRLYGRSAADVVAALEAQGWGYDAVPALLSLVREYLYQYAEKVDHAPADHAPADHAPARGRVGLHARLNRSASVWDAAVYRTHSANNYGCGIGVARLYGTGPVPYARLMDSAMADAISMDLVKSATDVYHLDAHQPTADELLAARRKAAYHALYLDLIDDLVAGGVPESLVHYGRAGFLYVPIMERYNERRTGRRTPLRPAVAARLRALFGDTPVDPAVERRFRARRTGA
ncbi:hypothetical protein ACWGB8_16255 [Kitasatospora sp. NPDC054939]